MQDKAYPNIHFLSDHQALEKWANKLPHWQQSSHATYFITFRLRDSIPREAANKLENERRLWMHQHPKPWNEKTTLEYHKTFSSRVDKLMDLGHGECILKDKRSRKALSETLFARNESDYILHNWVIMPNHVHILVTIPDQKPLGTIIGAWKKFSAIRINKITESTGPMWQRDYFDRIVREWDHFYRVARYIRLNPSKAGLDSVNYGYWEAEWIEKVLG